MVYNQSRRTEKERECLIAFSEMKKRIEHENLKANGLNPIEIFLRGF